MCLIALAWRTHPRYELALIANRDEFHDRPAAPAGADPLHPEVHGGRDLEQGGSWLLVSARGRLAAVTNVRAGPAGETAPRSRGALVRDFATGAIGGAGFLDALAPSAAEYGRFNLLLWDGATLMFGSNHPGFVGHAVAPGVHAMSNGAFDAPWPKSGHATRALRAWLESDLGAVASPDALAPLFAALADTTPAPDAALPDTGVGLALERALSPPFVRGPRYGTRCSTVVLVAADAITFVERRFGPDAQSLGESPATVPRTRA
ncbi:NRDE family protein [Lysobacter koreensis]|uniref:NRDE family protein n=1 Tax=Lysobacter koreensis TaxID=266122 RepID=A0ABW2YPL6_9GAMM